LKTVLHVNSTIKKEDIAHLPTIRFEGQIVVVSDQEKVREAVEYLGAHPVVGFDTETRPSFIKGKENKVSLLQLATGERCYLFRLNLIGMPDELAYLLNDESVRKIGLSLRDDFHALSRRVTIQQNSFIDLQTIVEKFGIKDKSLQKIYALMFNQRISKTQRLSNWDAPQLTKAQQFYAATDAWACYRIYQKLTNR